MNAPHSKACIEDAPTFELFATLFDVNGAEEINSAVRERSFITCKTTRRKVGHERITSPGTFDFTKETMTEQITYKSPATDNPVPLTKICKNMLRPNMAVLEVIVQYKESSHRMFFRKNELVLCIRWDTSVLQTTANSKSAIFTNKR